MKSSSRGRLVVMLVLLLCVSMLFGSLAHADTGSVDIPDTFIIIGNRCIEFNPYWIRVLSTNDERSELVNQIMTELQQEGWDPLSVPLYWKLNKNDKIKDLRADLAELSPEEAEQVLDQIIAVIPGEGVALAAVKAADAKTLIAYFTGPVGDVISDESFTVTVGENAVGVQTGFDPEEREVSLTLDLDSVQAGGRVTVGFEGQAVETDIIVVTNEDELEFALDQDWVNSICLVAGEYEGYESDEHSLFTRIGANSVVVYDSTGIAIALGCQKITSTGIDNIAGQTVIKDYVLNRPVAIATGSNISARFPTAKISFSPDQPSWDETQITLGNNVVLFAIIAEVNAAESQSAMQAALIEYAEGLKLDLTAYNALAEGRRESVAGFVMENRDNVHDGRFGQVADVKAAFEAGVAYQTAIQSFANAVNSQDGLTVADVEAMKDAYKAMGEFQNVSSDPQLVQVIGILQAYLDLDAVNQEAISEHLLLKIGLMGGDSWKRDAILLALAELVDDTTPPQFTDVHPARGTVVLGPEETFVWTIIASDANLYELEVDHNLGVPEFSLYADQVNPYGSSEAQADFESFGVEVTYDGSEWTIDFGPDVTDEMIAQGDVKFHIVLKDLSGNQFGTMYGTTPENTCEYTIMRDTLAPAVRVSVSPEPLAQSAEELSYTFVVEDHSELAFLEIDHSLGKHSGTPTEDQLPEFKLYPQENPWGTDEYKQLAEETYGVTATYDNNTWTLTFGQGAALTKIKEQNQFKLYYVVEDIFGNAFGSMNPTTPENTVVVSINDWTFAERLNGASGALVEFTPKEQEDYLDDAHFGFTTNYANADQAYDDVLSDALVEADQDIVIDVYYVSDDGSWTAPPIRMELEKNKAQYLKGPDNRDPLKTEKAKSYYRVKLVSVDGTPVDSLTQDITINFTIKDMAFWRDEDKVLGTLTSTYTAAVAPVINTTQTKGYPTIQAAIDDAGDCNTITVAPGTYYEVLQISKPLTLLGPNAGIAGYGERNPEAVITYPAGTEEEKSVRVTSDDVTIKGFYFQGDDRTIGNLEAIYARGNDLTVNNNVFDGYVLTQVRTYPVSSKEGFNEGLLIEGNLFKNKPVGNFALYVQGTSGDVKLNKFENVRHGLTIQPYHHSVGGRVEHNEVEAWRMGVWFNGAYVRSGEWVFDNNTITATEKPSEAEDTVWWGLTIETFGDGGPLVNGDLPSATFTNNTVDGAGASPEVETRGLSFHQPVKSDKLTINNNTFTNVDVGAYIHNPDGTEFMVIKLDDFFPSNTFPEGSMVIGHRILVPQNNTVYNMRSGAEYSDIQAAIDAATAGDTILVAPGTYVGNLEIDVVDLTLKSAEQHAAVIQTVSGFAAGNGYGGITVLADGVTIDGFRIEQGAAQAVIHTHDSDGVTIQNNQVVGLNGVNPRGIDVGYASAASDGVTIQYNEFEDLYCGVYVNKGTDLTIDDNEFVNMVDGAVVFDGTWPIGDVAVTNNTATDAGYLMYFYGGADSVQVDDNTLDNTELTNWGVYNLTQKRYSSTLQDAITRAEDEDTIEVVAGTYHEFLVIDKPITLLGPNAGVAGYSSERDEEAIITVPSGTDIEDPGSDTSSVITVNAPNVTIDGFRITGDNGNGLNDYAGYNIQAGNAITGYEDGLVVKNNVIDCFSYIGVKTSRTVNEVRVEQISNVSIKSNYFAHIHDLNQVGYGYALYVQGASGTIIGNVVKDSRTAIQVQPYGASGGGLVKDNVFEAYRLGAYYNYAERTAGPWVFENNSITAIAPPAAMAGPIAWDGIVVQTIGTHGDANSVPGIVTFTKNNIDGSATSSTDLNRLAVNGVRIIPSVDTDAVMVFGENTISGVEIGFQLDSGDLDLDMVLERNTFATGSKVIGHRILVPQQSTIYNMRSGAEYSDIQKAVDEAESNDTLLVTAGTYEEDLLIDVDDLTLVGPNADVPGNGTRAAEATIHGTVRIAADDVVLSGFSIENDGNTVIVNVDGSSGAMIQNNIVMQLNFQTAGNPCIGNLDISGTNSITIDNNLIQGSIGLYPTAAADVVITKNVIDNAPAEAIWLWGAGGSQQDYTLTISGNEVREFNLFELGNISAVKLVTKPASVNEKTQTSDIFDVIEEANEFDSVNLEWMTGVHNTTQDEFYSTIQEAIDEAADGEEITVAAGTYDEAVVVNKPLTLLGANSNVNPNTGERGEETVLTDRLTLTGDNVIAVDGFKFLNETFGENNQTAVAINGNGTYTVVNSVFERNNGKPKEELAGEEPLAIRGIEISAASSGSIDIQNNLFTGSAVDVYSNSSWNSAIYLNGGQQAVTIKDNVFEVSRTALNLDDFSNAITVTGNTFGSGNGTHISFGGTTPTSGSYSISGNDFAVVGAVFNLSKVDPAFRLDATGNTFDGKAPTEMSEEELFVLESLIWHKGKGGRNGFVRVLEDKVFVTTQSGTIAQAIAVAESGDTVRVAAGTYPENLTINKTLTLVGTGDDESGTILSPASGRIITLTAGGNAEGDRLTIKGIRLANGDSNGIFTDSTISHITIEDVTVTNMQSYGITIHNHAVVSDLKLNNVTVNDCSVGLRVRGSLNGLAVTDSSFDGNREGLSSVLPESDGDGTYLTHVTISDTTFNGNSRKGMYLEKLSDALFEGIEVVNSGTEVGYDYSTGVDINLKFAGYQNITIKDSKISGASNGAAGHGLAIKARDDGSYANNRATLTNVRIERVELTDNYNGILISGSITEPVVIVECVIKNIGFELGNLSTTSVTAIENWWGSERVEDIAAKVYGTVQYNPWYVDTSLTKLCTEAAVELVNATDDETEMQAVLRSNKVALDLDLSAYDNSLTEIGRLRVAVAMVAGRDYDSIQDVQDAFKNAVRVQELLFPINTASTPAGMMKAIDENGEELGLPDSYFDWTEPYQLQVAEVVLNSRRLGGYANAEALLAVVNPVVDDLAEEANAVVEVNDAANMAEIREALEAKAAILGLSTGDGSDYAALPEAYKNRVAQTMLAGEPYPDKTAIASAFEAAVVAEKAEADAVNVVNNATTSAEMGAALVDNAAALGLDLDDFHNLLEYYRGVVLEQLLGPEYADAAAIRVAVGAAVDTVKTESAAVAAVNAAADVAAMGAALDALGLDLTDYNTLVAYYQNEVARLMLDSVPYANKADVETAFADAVSQQMVTSAAVAAVNDAGNWQTMKVTLKDNEQALGLNMSAYDDLSSTEQNLVAAIMVAQRPANGYANHVQIQEMFTQAMAEVTGNGIAGMQALLGEEFDK